VCLIDLLFIFRKKLRPLKREPGGARHAVGGFSVEVDNSVLNVSSKKKAQLEKHAKEEKYTRRAFKCHAFSKSFILLEAVDADNIIASKESLGKRVVTK
jgi:hypothetical protein